MVLKPSWNFGIRGVCHLPALLIKASYWWTRIDLFSFVDSRALSCSVYLGNRRELVTDRTKQINVGLTWQ